MQIPSLVKRKLLGEFFSREVTGWKLFKNMVYEPVVLRFLRRHEIVAVGILFDAIQGLPGELTKKLVHGPFGAKEVIGPDDNIGHRSTGPTQHLMNHDFGMGQSKSFALCARREEK